MGATAVAVPTSTYLDGRGNEIVVVALDQNERPVSDNSPEVFMYGAISVPLDGSPIQLLQEGDACAELDRVDSERELANLARSLGWDPLPARGESVT